MSTVFRTEHVCRKFGMQEVLKDFALELDEGDYVAVMGPSGSGKSTFLHIAAGLLAADDGSIEIGGKDILAMSDSAATKFRRRHLGVVFQSFNLLNELTVRENIVLPLKLDGAKVDETRFQYLVEKLGLVDQLSKKPEQLSGGEQQRVAFARAMIAAPEVVLADEPTGNLDVKSAAVVCRLVKELNETEKSAMIVVTHDPVVAASAKKVAFIKNGSIVSIHPTNGDAAKVSRLYLETFGE